MIIVLSTIIFFFNFYLTVILCNRDFSKKILQQFIIQCYLLLIFVRNPFTRQKCLIFWFSFHMTFCQIFMHSFCSHSKLSRKSEISAIKITVYVWSMRFIFNRLHSEKSIAPRSYRYFRIHLTMRSEYWCTITISVPIFIIFSPFRMLVLQQLS